MSTITSETVNYMLIIHGVPLDWSSGVAYRKTKEFAAERQKIIKCPYCGKQLTSIDVSTRIELYRYPKKAEVSCHEYRKCHACRKMVGILFR